MAPHPHKGPFQKQLKHVEAVETRQPKYRGNDLIGGPGQFLSSSIIIVAAPSLL
jgi:hypothetical protein